MTNDFDDLFDDATKSYNAPPAAPREKMWEAIARARENANVIGVIPSEVEESALPFLSARSAQPARRVPRWIASVVGIAAVLTAGIVIGRMSRSPEMSPITVANAPVAPKPIAPDSDTTDTTSRAPATEATTPQTSSPRAAQRVGTVRPSPSSTPSARPNRALDVSGDDAAFRLAVVQHLTRTEVLLTSFRSQSSAADAKVDAQFASLSKELLSTTRMLLSRRSDDPTMTRLLQDLELVLMQLSQYAADGRRTDLDAVNQSIEKRNVLPKLRTAIPAGTQLTSGT